jgi:hypothetical protein
MNKIKITKEQAKLIKEYEERIGFRVTKSQLNRIFENYGLDEVDFEMNEIDKMDIVLNQDGFYILRNSDTMSTSDAAKIGPKSKYVNQKGAVDAKAVCADAMSTYQQLFEDEQVLTELNLQGNIIGPLNACRAQLGEEFESPFSDYEKSSASRNMTRLYKKETQGIKPKIKGLEEEELMGHPIGGSGKKSEYSPQSEKENEKTFKSFNEGVIKEDLMGPEFWNEVLGLIKQIYTNPSQEGLSPFWRQNGVTWGDMVSLLTASGLMLVGMTGAYELKRISSNPKDVVKKVGKALYRLIKAKQKQPARNTFKEPQPRTINVNTPDYTKNKFKDPNDPRRFSEEEMVQFGDDIEFSE